MTVEKEKRSFPTRRDFISLGIGAFVVGSVPFARRFAGPRLVRRTVPAMGTLAEIGVVHGDERYAQRAMDAAFGELRRVEALLTRHRDDSEIGQVNLGAFGSPRPVSDETGRVLQASLRWAEGSEGAFDPCLGRVMKLWDVGNRTRPPGSSQVRKFARRHLYRSLELDRSRGRPVVVFHDEDMGLDLGGIGKGYGVDRAAGVLREWGIENALVNVGGDLYALGVSEDGDSWKVGVRSPDDPEGIAATLPLKDGGVATSGDYLQYFEHGGRRYHHLLDPGTGEPSRPRVRSVTVAAPSCMDADAAATTAFASSVEKASGVMGRVAPGAEVVHTI